MSSSVRQCLAKGAFQGFLVLDAICGAAFRPAIGRGHAHTHRPQQHIPACPHPLGARPATVSAGRILPPGCGIIAGGMLIMAGDNAMLSR